MYNIPLFDSCTHPTISGSWNLGSVGKRSGSEELIREFRKNNVQWSFSIGLEGAGDYSEQKYAGFIHSHIPNAFPVAFVKPESHKAVRGIIDKLKRIKDLGYIGIKLHPRIGQFTLDNENLPVIIREANNQNLAVLMCTYFYSRTPDSHKNNTGQLLKLMEKIPDEKIILMHSGGIHLLEYIEIARAFSGVLLDISFTMLKYGGSSLDLDLTYAVTHFDRRICTGSDYPDFTPSELRSKFMTLTEGQPLVKVENIAYKNLLNFLDIKDYEIV